MAILLPERTPQVVVGVDSHKYEHQAAVLDEQGILLGNKRFSANSRGYRELTNWVEGFGRPRSFGVECTGSYAAGLTRFLRASDHEVIEINSVKRQLRAMKGKDDTIDAEAAARKVLAGEATALAKDTSGVIEAIRLLKVARDSAVKARKVAMVQMLDVLITVPAELRERIDARGTHGKVTQCLALRADLTRLDEPLQASKLALRTLARRVRFLTEEISEIDSQLDVLVASCAPSLLARPAIGTQHAAQLLITGGQNIERLTNDAAFARLCGVAPVPISSGQTKRVRLHRGGDRQANTTLHMIVVLRLRIDQRTKDYASRRHSEGMSKKDIIRCLKRYVAREVFHDLQKDLLKVGT
jgi:transposase